MEYLKYFDALVENKLINPIWRNIIILIEKELDNSSDKDDFLILFIILFSLNDDGNLCMSLDKDTLKKKWGKKLEGTRILLSENNTLNDGDFYYVKNKSEEVINNSLSKVTNLKEVVGKNKFFEIDNNWLYIKKFNTARTMIIKSIERLFNPSFVSGSFDYKKVVKSPFKLTDGQKKLLKKVSLKILL